MSEDQVKFDEWKPWERLQYSTTCEYPIRKEDVKATLEELRELQDLAKMVADDVYKHGTAYGSAVYSLKEKLKDHEITK